MIYLDQVKKSPIAQAALAPFFVRIYSREHGAYWRANRCGYTYRKEEAGAYRFEEALYCTYSCGPEKGISFEVAEPEYFI